MKQTLAQNTDNNSKSQLSKKSDGSNSSKWQVKKLGEVCEFRNGLWTGKKTPFQKVGVIRNANFTKDCFLDYSNIVYIDVEQKQFQTRQLIEGDIILEKSGGGPKQPVGRVVIFDKKDGDFSFSNFTSSIRVKDKNNLDFNFLHRYLFFEYISGATEKMQSHSTGIRNLRFDEYKEIPIPLPPLAEQKAIVAILDQAFGEIEKVKANTEQNLKNAKELFQSYLQGVFENKGDDWEEKKLGEVGSPKMCKRIFKAQTKTEGDIPFYKIGTFGKEPDAFISKEIYDEFRLKYSFPKKGDILISASGTIGRCIRYDGKPAYFQDSNIVWIDNDEKHVLNDFLFEFYGVCNWGSTKGATISRLYNDNLKNIKISFPKSLAEQKAIVQRLDALRAETQRLESIYRDKLLHLEELKKSILQKAFSGEL